MLLRLSVNMCVPIWVVCIVLLAMRIVLSYVLRIFWYLGILYSYIVVGDVYPGSCHVALYLAFGYTDGGMNELYKLIFNPQTY